MKTEAPSPPLCRLLSLWSREGPGFTAPFFCPRTPSWLPSQPIPEPDGRQTILLQDKQRKTYCVACQELNSDVDKDNPALNAQAALSQAREHQLASSELPTASRPAPQPPVPRPEHCEGAAAGLRAAQGPSPTLAPTASLAPDVLAASQSALLQKLAWASGELGPSTSLEGSIQLCTLIRVCAEALQGIRQLQQ
uniref:Zinc ribbon domain containing 2 n=1 Tax=Sarcophilus harrisii TaxID=9305 RepID=A0A7N4V662_SARHA